MDNIKELIKKFGNIVCAFATAYYLLLGLLNVDILHHMFALIGLSFLVNIAYIAIGLVGVYKVIEIYKPDLLKKLDNKKK
ncbi:MAG: hypothetical protein ACK5N8_07435 [Alphaproteobacteria bacterium]